MKLHNLYNSVSNCQMINETKCEECRRNASCKDFNILKRIKEAEQCYEQGNNFKHSSKDNQLKLIKDTKQAFINNYKSRLQEDWAKQIVNEFDKWEREIKAL